MDEAEEPPSNAGGAMSLARFGQDVELSSGDEHAKATKRYRTFHTKDPRRIVKLEHQLPAEVGLVGDALSVLYRTDKWHEDGKDTDYKHNFETAVKVYEPVGEQPWLGPTERPEYDADPIVLLGQCLGFFLRRHDDEEIYETRLPTARPTWLFCSANGHQLYVYDPDRGFRAVFYGGKLSVKSDGIDH